MWAIALRFLPFLSRLGKISGAAWLKIGAAVAVVVVVAGVYIYIQKLQSDVEAAETAKASAELKARELTDTVERMEIDRAAADEALAAERQAANALRRRLDNARRQAFSAPDSDDGEVAPVLKNALEALGDPDA